MVDVASGGVMENSMHFILQFVCFLFKVGGAPWMPHHGARHGGHHQRIFYTSLFFLIFAQFSLVPTPTKIPETRTNYQHTTT